jgi:hypothetical protein
MARVDVDAYAAWHMGRAYHELALPVSETIRRVRPMGPLGHCVHNGWLFADLLAQLRELDEAET